jgi:hypothetical protein
MRTIILTILLATSALAQETRRYDGSPDEQLRRLEYQQKKIQWEQQQQQIRMQQIQHQMRYQEMMRNSGQEPAPAIIFP